MFHADIYDFLDTKKISADEDVRVKTLSIGVVIPDKMIELARNNEPMYLFYPKNLYDTFGVYIDEIDMNEWYEKLINHPDIKKTKTDPRNLLERIAVTQVESGYPYIMFEDNVNNEHALRNLGKVKFSNLCSEILQYSELSEYTDYDEPDNIGQDISCNLGSLNIVNVMKDPENFDKTVSYSIKALTRVSDETDIKNAPAVRKANRLMHSVGLGALNLHGFLAQNGIAYESKDAIEFVDAFFRTVNFWAITESVDTAYMKGETFHGFEGSDYHTGKYFERYNEPFEIKSDRVKELFKNVDIPTVEDWQRLAEDVKQYGMYHAYLTAIAPTGSISYVQSATASVMPITERVEVRTYGDSTTYYPMPELAPNTWFLYKEAFDMDMYKVVDLIATIQKHVHQGISFTLFVKETINTRELSKIYLYAHYKGIKTLYYTRQKSTQQDECLSCAV